MLYQIFGCFTVCWLGLTTVAFASSYQEPSYSDKDQLTTYQEQLAFTERLACTERLEQIALNPSWQRVRELQLMPRCTLEAKVAAWITLQQGDTGAAFSDYTRFIEAHPGWPLVQNLRQKAEFVAAEASPQQRLQWFQQYPPTTGSGVFAYLEAVGHLTPARLAEQIRKSWINVDLTPSEEKTFLERYHRWLGDRDYLQRAQRLLAHKNWVAAHRLIPFMPEAHRQVLRARIALIRGSAQAERELIKSGPVLTRDPGLALDYLHWLRQRKDQRAYDFLLKHKKLLARDPVRLWKETHILIRRSLEENRLALALRLVEGHGLKEGKEYAEAEWLRGWLYLRAARRATHARHVFQHLYLTVSTPISRARAAYWVAKACEECDPTAAAEWFQRAAQFPTTFYGQQAIRQQGARIILRKKRLPSMAVQKRFNHREMVQVIHMLQTTKLKSLNRHFLFALVKQVPVEEKILAVKLAYPVDPEYTVSIAREAAQFGEIVCEESYPLLAASILKHAAPIDRALLHAIVRRESGFDSRIESPAGAVGLMQVMPETGRMLAKQLNLPFKSAEQLKDPVFNVRLGSEYLRLQLEQFNGATVLALAAYNAGPQAVREWIACFGDPRLSTVDMIDWIEKIPYGETRNYVQRILESYGVYKAMMQEKPSRFSRPLTFSNR
jgi:soluble lytic murein transglycosylase